MNQLLILICSLPLFACGQLAKFPTKTDLTKIYAQAITDFIKDANKKMKELLTHCSLENVKTDNQTTFPILNYQRG
jgi:hypothetical protein